ncbi:hypothetical protein BDQ17DRAFT_1248301, partial [Cyathus striatus]
PTNYVSISRTHSNIRETYTLDPTLYIPTFLLPPLAKDETEETRKNLKLEVAHGCVNAKVKLVESDEGNERKRKRVTMAMKSEHGGISAKIMGPPTRPPFHIHLKSTNGDIRLHIPRNFHGPITVSLKHGSLKFSESLSRGLTTFGDVNGTRTGFIGDFSAASVRGKPWDGDEINVEARHGCVRVQFDDDEGGRVVSGKPSFLNRVFGF